MCGRFTLTVSPDELRLAFPDFDIPGDLPPSYNIAPSQPIPVVPNEKKPALTFFRWGLVPSWSKDEKFGGYNLINARAETVAEKPSFRSSFRRRRCLILADGFYEWKKNPGASKTPYFISLKDREPFGFAGLWDEWISPHGDPLRSACIITTEPNPLVKPIHNRMPVILPRESHQRWLQPREGDTRALQVLLEHYPAHRLKAYPVSPYVNSPGNNSPRCIEPAGLL